MQIWQVDWVQGLDPWGRQSQELKKTLTYVSLRQ
jgi:hypothetical protein